MKFLHVLATVTAVSAISSGANEPIADNELGLTTKDCALQYCKELDALALWLTFVNECKTHEPVLVTHGNKHTIDPVARHDARSCAMYLCPALADTATKYLQTGCIVSFRTFRRITSTTK
jgi:hypothetical protein